MNEILDWVEDNARENIRFRLQNAETLAKEASTTLTILLTGIAAALAYVVNESDTLQSDPLVFSTAIIVMWLTIVGALLVSQCMLSEDLPSPSNEPKNLLQEEYSLDALKRAELKNIQERIHLITNRNHRIAVWLDRCRLLALCTPVVFLITALSFSPVL